MAAIIPSYVGKVTRAKKHLVDLKEAIDAYAAGKPYTVRKGIEGKKHKTVHRLVFTVDPANTDIPIIAADAIYNFRSGLDHLMSSMVANKDRTSAIFPIFFQRVWEAPAPGENAERLKQRGRWTSDTKSLKAPAVAILKALQPPEDAGDGTDADRLQVINSLSNRDRHEKLPVLVAGLREFTISMKSPAGKHYKGIAEPDLASDFAHNDAQLRIPDDAVDVKIEGTPLIVVRVGKDKRGRDRHLPLLFFLEETLPFIEQRGLHAAGPLRPQIAAGSSGSRPRSASSANGNRVEDGAIWKHVLGSRQGSGSQPPGASAVAAGVRRLRPLARRATARAGPVCPWLPPIEPSG
jgi:hypothetical protein